jgi:hypothetical protein
MSRGFISFVGFTGNALAEALQGFLSLSGVARLGNHQHLRTRGSYAFVQDTWRVRRDLTVNLGMRYEYNSPRGGYEADYNNFAPRIGFSWRPGLRRTVLRAGYGFYYDQGIACHGGRAVLQPAVFRFPVVRPVRRVSDHALRSVSAQLPDRAAVLRDGRLMELAYAASKGTKMLGARDINQPAPSTRQPNLRPLPQLADIDILESRGNSNYHSLRRLSRRTRGRSRSTTCPASSSARDDAYYPQDSRYTHLERGLSNYDLRHRFSLSYSYDLPLGRGRLLGG